MTTAIAPALQPPPTTPPAEGGSAGFAGAGICDAGSRICPGASTAGCGAQPAALMGSRGPERRAEPGALGCPPPERASGDAGDRRIAAIGCGDPPAPPGAGSPCGRSSSPPRSLRLLTARQVAAYDRDGYVDGGPLLTAGEVDALRAELDRVIAERGRQGVRQPVSIANLSADGEQELWQVVNIWQASEAFARLLRHPRLVAMLRQLAGPDGGELRLWHDQIQYKPAGHGAVNWWHQDAPYWPALAPQDSLLTAWIALDQASLDNGCMSMVPGSHRWGDTIEHLHACRGRSTDFWRSLGEEFEGRPVHVVPRTVPLGGVHFHHALTWHGSPENRSARPRRAIAIHVMTRHTRFQPRGPHLMTPFITAAPGQPITDAAFPALGSAGSPSPA